MTGISRCRIVKTAPAGRDRKGEHGFTLLELLIAMVVISISFMAILPLLWNTMTLNATTSMGSKARDIAAQQIESLMTQPRDVIDTLFAGGTSYVSPVEYLGEKGEVLAATDPKVRFRRSWSINQVPNVTTDPKPVMLTSVVQFDYKGETRNRTFTTLWSF